MPTRASAPLARSSDQLQRKWTQVFVSFFPAPRLFFWSAITWAAICIAGWYLGGAALGDAIGLAGPADGQLPIGIERFWSGPFLWFYLYYTVAVAALRAGLAGAARRIPGRRWSILGSALILFTTYFQVEVSVAINDWYGPFYDLVQAALEKIAPGHARGVRRLCS